MTRLATGTAAEPQLSGVFVAAGRAVVAAGLSIAYLLFIRAPLPARQHWRALALVGLGVVLGFPLCTSIAMRHVEAVHASVMVGILPLATAAAGALLQRWQPGGSANKSSSWGFWLCATLGSGLVVAYALLRAGDAHTLHWADALLLLAMGLAAIGYAWGARLSQQLGAEAVICWALLLALPVTLPLTVLTWPSQAIAPTAWAGFAYVAVFSMWLGFFAWYRGLALGGTVRVSQIQLVQPFLGMVFALPLLGEQLDGLTLGFALAVLACVLLGRRLSR